MCDSIKPEEIDTSLIPPPPFLLLFVHFRLLQEAFFSLYLDKHTDIHNFDWIFTKPMHSNSIALHIDYTHSHSCSEQFLFDSFFFEIGKKGVAYSNLSSYQGFCIFFLKKGTFYTTAHSFKFSLYIWKLPFSFFFFLLLRCECSYKLLVARSAHLLYRKVGPDI